MKRAAAGAAAAAAAAAASACTSMQASAGYVLLHALQARMQPSCITWASVHKRNLALIMRACRQAPPPTDMSTGHTLPSPRLPLAGPLL